MGGLWTMETEQRMLQDHLDQSVHIRLFANSLAPARETALTSLVTIASGNFNYAPVEIGVGSWSINSASPACYAVAPMVVWTFMASAGPIYGYYYTAVNSETYPMGGVEQFSDGPYSMIRTGQQLSITPTIAARGVNSWGG